jgi:hypothetical protein
MMKIKSGFISNSSSASLVIIWQDHHRNSLETSLKELCIDDDSVDFILSKTSLQERDFYHSSFWTVMYNNNGFENDFPTEASVLLDALAKADTTQFCYTYLIIED